MHDLSNTQGTQILSLPCSNAHFMSGYKGAALGLFFHKIYNLTYTGLLCKCWNIYLKREASEGIKLTKPIENAKIVDLKNLLSSP